MQDQDAYKIIFPLLVVMMVTTGCTSTFQVVIPIPAAEAESMDEEFVKKNNEFYAELSFEKNSARMNSADEASIKDLIKKSNNQGSVERIQVLTWFDQKKLADVRCKNIKEFLKKNFPKLKVNVVNMTNNPNEFKSIYRSANAQTQASFVSAGLTMNDADMNPPAKALRALVLTMMKKAVQ